MAVDSVTFETIIQQDIAERGCADLATFCVAWRHCMDAICKEFTDVADWPTHARLVNPIFDMWSTILPYGNPDKTYVFRGKHISLLRGFHLHLLSCTIVTRAFLGVLGGERDAEKDRRELEEVVRFCQEALRMIDSAKEDEEIQCTGDTFIVVRYYVKQTLGVALGPALLQRFVPLHDRAIRVLHQYMDMADAGCGPRN